MSNTIINKFDITVLQTRSSLLSVVILVQFISFKSGAKVIWYWVSIFWLQSLIYVYNLSTQMKQWPDI
jgi:hypothetical protein